MAKGRMLSVKAGKDPDLNSMSIEAELVFLLTIPHLDRDGLIEGDPIPLWGKVVPRRVELMDKMARIIQEWVERGVVVRYEWKDGAILFFPGFRKHNINMAYDREPLSDFPPPPGFHHTRHGLIPDDPEIAVRLAETVGERSKYHSALMEAAEQPSPKVDINLHVNSMQSTGKVRAEVEDQQQTEVEVEENNNSALREVTRQEAETAVVVVGVESLLTQLDDDQVMDLLTWLWLYNGWNQKDLSYRDIFRGAYAGDPFAGMKNIGAVIVSNARARSPAPLVAADREDLAERLARPASEATL